MLWKEALINRMNDFLLRKKTAEKCDILDCFETPEEKTLARSEFFDLPKDQKDMLKNFITKPDYAKACLVCLSYLATALEEDEDSFGKTPLAAMVSDCIRKFESKFPVMIQPDDVLTLLAFQDFQETIGFKANGYPKTRFPEFIRLVAYAVYNECSVWSESKSIAEIMEEQLLIFHSSTALELLSEEKIDKLLSCWITDAGTTDRNNGEMLLFRLLTTVKLNVCYIGLICDQLFKSNSITPNEAQTLIEGSYENKDLIRDYIARRFGESINNGHPQFLFPMACFYIDRDQEDTLYNAKKVIGGEDPYATTHDKVIYLSVVSLAGWLQLRKTRVPYLQTLSCDSNFVSQVIDLVAGDPVYFEAGMNCLEDLYLTGNLDNRLLDREDLIEKAMLMLDSANEDFVTKAEKLLCLLPLYGILPAKLISKYLHTYECNLGSGKYQTKTIVLFRILAKTGYWGKKEKLFAAYKELYLHAAEAIEEVVEEDMAYLQLMRQELWEMFSDDFSPASSEDVVKTMDEPLSSEATEQMHLVLRNLLKDPNATHTAIHQEAVLQILKYARPSTALILERTEVPLDLSPLLATWWFAILARTSDHPDRVHAFYQQFSKILNRPALYPWEKNRRGIWHQPFQNFAKFLETKSRVALILQLAPTATIQFFLNQNSLPKAIRCEVEEILTDRYFDQDDKEKNPFRKLFLEPELYDIWNFFYDDKGVIKEAVRYIPNAITAILKFGYDSDVEVTQLALENHPWQSQNLAARIKESYPTLSQVFGLM